MTLYHPFNKKQNLNHHRPHITFNIIISISIISVSSWHRHYHLSINKAPSSSATNRLHHFNHHHQYQMIFSITIPSPSSSFKYHHIDAPLSHHIALTRFLVLQKTRFSSKHLLQIEWKINSDLISTMYWLNSRRKTTENKRKLRRKRQINGEEIVFQVQPFL